MKEYISRLTWVDYLAIIAVLRGCYVGYKSGLFPELLRIAAYLITAIVTLRFHATVTQLLTLKTFLNETTASIASYAALIIVTFLATKLLTALILNLLKLGEGGFFYRLLGLILGACRWVILLSLLFMAIDYSPLTTLKSDIHSHSVSGPDIVRIAPMLFDFMSGLSPELAVPKHPA